MTTPPPDATTDPADPVEDEPETGPTRRCIVTRDTDSREKMLRFVIGPDNTVVPDLAAKLPGRGLWLSARGDVLERAVTRGAFAKAARCAVHVPPDLRLRIEDGLRRRVRDQIGLARRAGQAVAGWAAVKEWLLAGRVGLLVEAADGSLSERDRLLGRRDVPVVTPLTAADLGGVFGRDQAVHVAVAPGRLAGSIATEAQRLAGFAGGPSTPGTV
ncbi:RNA-binding protein [Humitalea sp. 24SJ18S-53]|uniref:RNA-binding protein n=1 Tax=Humitalea sp. 24SJ18S-53 TaxID=3422307 RepID=UPI003D67A05E